ncbi:glycosyltransferase [Arthrobacter sp. NicSoilC5]|uniref:glycosyltransferase n=1 Tax=Arthrobacter sp. NicSoilC5 TaxID=2831000 RepID=UPI001CC4FB3E|nr:glycosyltransferase [Arthrobacter sp. NicSoilC5]
MRDITLGLVEGFRRLAQDGKLDLVIAGDRAHDEIDIILPSKGFMHLSLPLAALRHRADRIIIPRQTVPFISAVRSIPVFMDIGFLRVPQFYSKHLIRDLTTKYAVRCREIVAISEYTANELAEAGLSTSVLPLPIQAIHPIKWTPAPDDRYLLCVAAQEPHKNLARLVEAWREAGVSGWRMVLCGRPGAASPEIRDTIKRLGLDESVQVVSGLDDYAYESLLAGCSGYVQPSFDEGLCIPALDLAAAGAPTVVSALGNLGFVYGSSRVPSTFDPYSVSSIAQSIRRLVEDQEFRHQISSWNLANVGLTDWTAVANAVLGGIE